MTMRAAQKESGASAMHRHTSRSDPVDSGPGSFLSLVCPQPQVMQERDMRKISDHQLQGYITILERGGRKSGNSQSQRFLFRADVFGDGFSVCDRRYQLPSR
jgi:hypothetical protein